MCRVGSEWRRECGPLGTRSGLFPTRASRTRGPGLPAVKERPPAGRGRGEERVQEPGKLWRGPRARGVGERGITSVNIHEPMNIHSNISTADTGDAGGRENPPLACPEPRQWWGFEPVCRRTQQGPSAKVTKEPGLVRAWPAGGGGGCVAALCHGLELPGRSWRGPPGRGRQGTSSREP